MPITEQQRRDRFRAIGSSDSPPIVGVDPWKNRTDVWIEKTHPVDDFIAGEAVELGNEYEEPLIRWAGRELGIEVDLNVHVGSREHEIIRANLDGRGKGSPNAARVGLEAKVTSLAELWGEEGTDEIPERTIVQTQHQMFAGDLDVVFVPMLTAEFGRLRRKLYRVERNEQLIAQIVERDLAFWHDFVLPKRMPIDISPSLEIVKRIRRTPDSFAQVDPELVALFVEAKAKRKAAEKAEEEAQARLLLAAGTAEGIDAGDPAKVWTYLEQGRWNVDGKRLKIRDPQLYAECAKESRFRVLREVNRF